MIVCRSDKGIVTHLVLADRGTSRAGRDTTRRRRIIPPRQGSKCRWLRDHVVATSSSQGSRKGITVWSEEPVQARGCISRELRFETSLQVGDAGPRDASDARGPTLTGVGGTVGLQRDAFREGIGDVQLAAAKRDDGVTARRRFYVGMVRTRNLSGWLEEPCADLESRWGANTSSEASRPTS